MGAHPAAIDPTGASKKSTSGAQHWSSVADKPFVMSTARRKAPHSSNPRPTKVTHAKAFAAIESEIAAVPDHALVNITTDIPQSVQTAMGAAKRIEVLMPDLVRLPSDLFDLSRALNLQIYAGATLYAHLQVAEIGIPHVELRAMLKEAFLLRGELLSVADALGALGLVPAARVASIPRGRGHRSIASSLTALASLYDAAWPQLGSPIPVTRGHVERAAVLAANLLQALGERQLGTERLEPVDEARRTRARAYSLFMKAYGTCRQGVSFVRWWQGDADRFVPSLHRRTRRPVPTTAPEPSSEHGTAPAT
jgi:hypothetical protein